MFLSSSIQQPKIIAAFSLRMFITVFSAVFIFFSCKKEQYVAIGAADTGVASKPNNVGGKPDIIVHAGSSIQAAVDAATGGSVIFIEPGVYKEAIVVNKPGIRMVGASEKDVIIENPGDLENGITVRSEGDGFTLMNVTVKGFEENGVFLIRVDKYLLSHITATDNGEYGLFPIFCTNGVVEHCTASGHSDTGIYIGQSSGAEVKFNTVFANVNGIEIENSSEINVTNNQCYDNVAGMLVVLLPGLRVKESFNILISNNHVYKNNHVNFADPEEGFEAFVPSGSGILIVGCDHVTAKKNNVHENNFVGIATVSTLVLGSLAGIPPEAFADIEPNPDHARVINNIVMNNGAAKPAGIRLPGVDLLWDGSGSDNCWSGNKYGTSYPQDLPVCN